MSRNLKKPEISQERNAENDILMGIRVSQANAFDRRADYRTRGTELCGIVQNCGIAKRALRFCILRRIAENCREL